MAYMKIYTYNGSWTCPKTGDYKIICIGNGGNGTSNCVGNSGELNEIVVNLTAGAVVQCTFSNNYVAFGSYLSVNSGGVYSPAQVSAGFSSYAVGGSGGYTLDGVYGGVGAVSGVTVKDGALSVAVTTPASKNGGPAGHKGFGYGAGGGCSGSSYTTGSGGAIIIAQL